MSPWARKLVVLSNIIDQKYPLQHSRNLFYLLFCRDYAERVVASFANQIQSKYYGGNISVYIEVIALEYFSAVPKTDINSTKQSRQRHAVFHSFLSDDRKQDADTTNAHRKRFISLIKDKKILTKTLSTIWENSDGCAKPYRCASELYLMSVMSQCHSIIIDRGISASGHGK